MSSSPHCDIVVGKGMHHHVIPTERCGAINVYVQGDLEKAHSDEKEKVCAFLTVHDVGTNHAAWIDFLSNPAMDQINQRSIFIHVDVLGQEQGASDLEFTDCSFPTLQMLGEDLVNILDTLRVKYVIGMGVGAGANIITRFALMHVTRCLGVVCIQPTVTTAGMMEQLKDKMEELHIIHTNIAPESTINRKNMQMYLEAFVHRSDLSVALEKHPMQCDALIICGAKSNFIKSAEAMMQHCLREKTSMIKIENADKVLVDAPDKLAQSILLFCKGIGWLTSVVMPGVVVTSASDRRKSMSMQEFDIPNARRLSLSPGGYQNNPVA